MDSKSLHKPGAHTISVEDFPRWASERIAGHEKVIAMLVGKANALQYGLGMVMGLHPEPEQLLARWNEARPDLVDAEMQGAAYETEAYRDAFQSTLAFLTKTLEAAAGSPRDDAD